MLVNSSKGGLQIFRISGHEDLTLLGSEAFHHTLSLRHRLLTGYTVIFLAHQIVICQCIVFNERLLGNAQNTQQQRREWSARCFAPVKS